MTLTLRRRSPRIPRGPLLAWRLLSSPVMSENQREYFRAPLEVDVTMVSENNFYAGLTDNISEGGVFVATYQPPSIGSEVELLLRLGESDQMFRFQGVVCWIRSYEASCDGVPPGCGIKWVSLPAEAKLAIQR